MNDYIKIILEKSGIFGFSVFLVFLVIFLNKEILSMSQLNESYKYNLQYIIAKDKGVSLIISNQGTKELNKLLIEVESLSSKFTLINPDKEFEVSDAYSNRMKRLILRDSLNPGRTIRIEFDNENIDTDNYLLSISTKEAKGFKVDKFTRYNKEYIDSVFSMLVYINIRIFSVSFIFLILIILSIRFYSFIRRSEAE